MMIGRSRFVWFNAVALLLLGTPLAKVPRKRTRVAVYLLMVVLTSGSILPFLAPAFNRSYLAGLKTRLDAEGVCRQSNDYTCCPAAAVTVLRKLGLPAEEGELAILAHTSSLTGTEPDVLAKVLQKRYHADGLVAEYRAFKDVTELKKAGLMVAVLKFNTLQDHCVAILGVQNNRILVADPLSGLRSMSVEEFENQWLFVGIVMDRIGVGSGSLK
jgi:predicted double-glycine peptidase